MKEYLSKKNLNTTSAGGSGGHAAMPEIGNQAYLRAVLAGRAKADSATMGHRRDLAPSLNAKMSKAFGMDLSRVQLYRTDAMAGTETKGISSGNKIVLSGDIDLNTTAGQAILGHEISHVRAQSRGIGLGHTGLYNNAALEHQADMEGMMAARGQSILGESTGMDTGSGMNSLGSLAPLGPGMSASAGAPMQAWSLKNLFGKKEAASKPDPLEFPPNEDIEETVPKKEEREGIDFEDVENVPEVAFDNVMERLGWDEEAREFGKFRVTNRAFASTEALDYFNANKNSMNAYDPEGKFRLKLKKHQADDEVFSDDDFLDAYQADDELPSSESPDLDADFLGSDSEDLKKLKP